VSATIDDLALALRLAIAGGVVARRDFGLSPHRLGIRFKPGGQGPVTNTDIEVDRLVAAGLREATRGDGIVTEESRRKHPGSPTAARTWYVDPIDGTRDFARGRPGWAISVGLCVDGRPVLGVLHEPMAGWTGWALRTDGTDPGWIARQRRDGVPTGPDDPDATDLRLRPAPKAFVLATGAFVPFSRAQAIRRQVQATRVRRVGSVALRMAMVARGEADAYVQAPGRLKRWDTCAAHALVEGAGGHVTDMCGDALIYAPHPIDHPRGIVVAGPRIHAQVLRRLDPARSRWLDDEA
jgi:fructose-1,6-bisphosphatase/inositol monophosphatase family enzyme